MHKTIKGLAVIAALATATACSDGAGSPTGSSLLSAPEQASLARDGSQLTFSSTRSNSIVQDQTSSGGAGSIAFTGSVTTGNPCYDVTATHSNRNGVVTLTVDVTSNGNICMQVMTYHNYQGQVSGLAPGTYTFTVVHDVDGTRTTAHQNTVVVQ